VRAAVPPPRAVAAAAVDFVIDAYEGVAVRPGKGLPHAQAVADILRDAGADERTQVAALLHDVVEDTPRDVE
jgi:(p)ppGpp synthase/HD superfamily hydrolase